ncbi:MAG: hypothetical protein ACRD8W_12780, partial [Nitrososphaeraceae archaeon]
TSIPCTCKNGVPSSSSTPLPGTTIPISRSRGPTYLEVLSSLRPSSLRYASDSFGYDKEARHHRLFRVYL